MLQNRKIPSRNSSSDTSLASDSDSTSSAPAGSFWLSELLVCSHLFMYIEEHIPKRTMSVLASSIQNLGRRYLPHDSDDDDKEENISLLGDSKKHKLPRHLERSVTIDLDGKLGSRLGGNLSSKVASVRNIKGPRRSRFRHRDALRAMIEAENKWQPAGKRYSVC